MTRHLTSPIRRSTPRRRRRLVARTAAFALIVSGMSLASTGLLGANAEGCGEYSFGFTGTRLINDGISDSAGPFTITLPAGTYDVTMWSNDNHPTPDYQTDQTQEQWYFRLDNGYVSPPTADIPNDAENITTNLSAVELEAATAISVHHLGEGGVNSVNVECVGFTPTIIIAPPTTTTVAPAVATTTTTIAEAKPPTTTVAPAVTEAPTTTAAAAVTTTTAAPAATTTVPVEVKPSVEVPEVKELAVTGANDDLLVALGLALMGVGFTLTHAARRSELALANH